MNFRLDWATNEAAKYAVEHWHYSKTMPKYKTVKIGAWEDVDFIGCFVFSRGATPALLNPYGLEIIEGCELTRIAFRQHRAPITQMLAISLKMLKRASPGLRLVVSFADPFRGHIGVIYQASNWFYTGVTAESKQYVDSTGKLWHERNVSETGFKKYGVAGYQKVLKPTAATKIIKMPGKYRYLYPLDSEMRQRILPLSRPYPKRATSETIDTPGHQPGEGGEAPTVALQSKDD